MTTEILLHIGTEKTGTTSIQRTLARERRTLGEAGYLYPASLGDGPHIALTACALDDFRNSSVLSLLGIKTEEQLHIHRNNVVRKLKEEIENSENERILIIDEHLNVHLRVNRSLEKIKRILSEIGKVKNITIYVRRQDAFNCRMVSEAIKNRSFCNVNFINPIYDNPKSSRRYKYMNIIEKWRSVFAESELIVRGYPEDPKFDVVADFVNQLQLPAEILGGEPERLNRSIPARVLKPLTLLGVLATRNENAIVTGYWREIVGLASTIFPGAPFVLDPESRRAFMDRFQASNEALCKDFPHLERVLFAPVTDDDPVVGSIPLATLVDGLVTRLPASVAEQILALEAELSRRGGGYEAAFPPEIIDRWDAAERHWRSKAQRRGRAYPSSLAGSG